MALFTPSESPAVVVKEVDLSGVVPNVQTSTGATVGKYRWGPAEERKKVSNESELVSTFASPDSNSNIDFHMASQFLKYSNSLHAVRGIGTGAVNSGVSTKGIFDSSGGSQPTKATLVKNDKHFDSAQSGLEAVVNNTGGKIQYIGRFPGALGNSLSVHLLGATDSAVPSGFNGWTYKNNFQRAPKTSTYAAKFNSQNDECHLAVVDSDGLFTGTQGTVLEAYDAASVAPDAKLEDGTSNYIKDLVNKNSNYIRFLNFDSAKTAAGAGATRADVNGTNFDAQLVTTVDIKTLAQGVDGGTLSAANVQTGFDLFEDKDTVEVDFLISPSMVSRADQKTVVNDLVATAQSLRKDCIVVASPARSDVINVANSSAITTNIVDTGEELTASSYLVYDANFTKVYDKFNDKFIFIPASASTAGLLALSDNTAAPWFSPAGSRRGNLLGITDLAWSPTKSQRDTLYRNYINPVVNIPGQGTMLFGDKTHLLKNSAFDRINVRRLFLSIERAISVAARNVMFEFNDEFTRTEFVNVVEPFLREIKGRRGITDFKLVCDSTNNTSAVIDRNEFIANVFVKPARSINFVTLNFVAVRTGVDFTEIVGTV